MDRTRRSRPHFYGQLAAIVCLPLILASAPVAAGTARSAPVARATSPKGPPVPGAPNCQMFPADNVWNTDISKLPVNKHSATWMANMDASTTNLHPDFGPDEGGYPYG